MSRARSAAPAARPGSSTSSVTASRPSWWTRCSRCRSSSSLCRSRHKQRAAFSGPSGNRGWIKLGNETLDPGKPLDLKEAFNIGLELDARRSRGPAGKPFRGVNCWPDLAGFPRPPCSPISTPAGASGSTLHRAFAIDLGLAPDIFDEVFDRPMATLRLLHYPPPPPTLSQGQLGAGVHTDYGNVTLLATDEAGGLMVRHRSGRMDQGAGGPDAFVCNIGDCLMRWTNDVYVSTPHKVENPPGRHRYSVAFFLDPNPEANVACLPTCIAPGRPPKYPPGHSRGVSPFAPGADLCACAAEGTVGWALRLLHLVRLHCRCGRNAHAVGPLDFYARVFRPDSVGKIARDICASFFGRGGRFCPPYPQSPSMLTRR